MIKFLKNIARILILLFCFFLLLLIVKQFFPIEYSNNQTEYFFESLLFYGFPSVLLLSLFITIKQKDNTRSIFSKIIITILLAALSFFIMFGAAVSESMCAWSTGDTIFENKQNKTIKIVKRSFGCGATDSGSPTHAIFKIREITAYFIWATKIDTNSIDKTKWNRITKITE